MKTVHELIRDVPYKYRHDRYGLLSLSLSGGDRIEYVNGIWAGRNFNSELRDWADWANRRVVKQILSNKRELGITFTKIPAERLLYKSRQRRVGKGPKWFVNEPSPYEKYVALEQFLEERIRRHEEYDPKPSHLLANIRAVEAMKKHLVESPDDPYLGPLYSHSMGRGGRLSVFESNEIAVRFIDVHPEFSGKTILIGNAVTYTHLSTLRDMLEENEIPISAIRNKNITLDEFDRRVVIYQAKRRREFDQRRQISLSEQREKNQPLLTDSKSCEVVFEKDGYTWIRALTPERARAESICSGATWCTGHGMEHRYVSAGSSEMYFLKDPTGVARVAAQRNLGSGRIEQLRNRKQSGEISAELKPYVRDFMTVTGFPVVDQELKGEGYDH